MMNSSSESVNVNSAPAMMAGASRGRTTYRKRLNVFAPRSLAARSRLASKPCRRAATSSRTNGVVYTLWPMTAVVGESSWWNTLVNRTSRLTPIRRPRDETTSRSRAIGILDFERAAEDRQENHDQPRNQQGGGCTACVLHTLEEVDDQVSDHHALRASDELRCQVLPEDRDEDEDHSSGKARPDLRKQDAPDGGSRRRAEVHRSTELVPVEALERRVERERGEREIERDEDEDDRRAVVENKRQ